MSSVIETRSVVVEYPSIRGVLRLYDQGVSLKVDQGDFLAVLGGSGWGKSTLVNVVLGLEKPIHGSVSFRDHDVTRESFVKRCSLVKTAAVFQRPTALPQMTVSQNLHLALSLAGVPRKERDERIKEALAFFGLDKIERSYPDGLSAGQRVTSNRRTDRRLGWFRDKPADPSPQRTESESGNNDLHDNSPASPSVASQSSGAPQTAYGSHT